MVDKHLLVTGNCLPAVVSSYGGSLMANQNYSIDQRLLNAQVAIDNSINSPELLAIVTLYGYDLLRLQAARALHDEIRDLVAIQKGCIPIV